MNTEQIKKLWEAYVEVSEKKLDPVDDKALDKKFKDREDKDIDNDGDVDSSDEYLHKRRQAVNKAIEKEKGKEKKEEEEKDAQSSDDDDEEEKKKEKEKKGFNSKTSDNKAEISKIAEAKMEDSDVLSAAKKLASNGKDEKAKTFGQGLVDFYEKNKSFTPDQVAGLQNIMKNASFQLAKEDSLGEAFEVLWNAIQEASEPKNRKGSATEPEGIMDKESPKSKEFADKHKKSDKDYEDMPKDAVEKTTEAGRGVKSQAPARSGDNMKGDKKVVNPVKEDTRSERNKIMDILSGKTWNELRDEHDGD